MENSINTEIWRQFGASLDMFENALQKCPESLWDDGQNFWYIAYHTLFWTDYYLSSDPDNYQPPEPYTLDELGPKGLMPERTYSKVELLNFTKHCRNSLQSLLSGPEDVLFTRRWVTDWRDFNMLEMQLYNMRHVQHHTGQLNLLLGKIDHDLPIWVSQNKAVL